MPVTDQTPEVILYDVDGNPMALPDATAIGATQGLLVMATDVGGVARIVLARSDGVLEQYLPLGTELSRVNSGYVASGVIANAAATLRDLSFVYKGPAGRFFQIFNSATVPANGATPAVAPQSLPSGAGQRVFGNYTPMQGDRFSTGISFALSTTEDTLTLDTGANNLWVTAQYTSH